MTDKIRDHIAYLREYASVFNEKVACTMEKMLDVIKAADYFEAEHREADELGRMSIDTLTAAEAFRKVRAELEELE